MGLFNIKLITFLVLISSTSLLSARTTVTPKIVTNPRFQKIATHPNIQNTSKNDSQSSLPGKAKVMPRLGGPRGMLNRLAMSYNQPEQIHVSFGSRVNDIVIMWSSSSNEKSFVEYGNSPLSISRIPAQSTELKEHSENAKRYIHRAELKDLTPGEHYTYRIIAGPSEIKSKVMSVDVPHNDTDKIHTLMVVADMGLLSRSLQFIVHEALSNKYDAVFHVGDIAYNLDAKGGSVGDQFMNRIQKFTSRVPYMTIPGDHERFFDFYHYRHRFSTPGAHWPMKEDELWYSIDIGQAHIISINTQNVQMAQLNWIRRDLLRANKNRQKVPWVIVMGHKPLYCTETIRKQDCDDEYSKLRAILEDLFFEYGVDIYISGHKHCYERSWPMYKSHSFQFNSIEPKAPIYIIIGTLGYPYLMHEQKSSPKWLASSVTEKGKELYGRLQLINSTHLSWSAHVGTNNKKVDEMLVIQHFHGPFGMPGQTAIDELKGKSQLKNDHSTLSYKPVDIYDSSNRHIMLFIGVFSFSFLVFLLMKYSRIKTCCR